MRVLIVLLVLACTGCAVTVVAGNRMDTSLDASLKCGECVTSVNANSVKGNK